MSAAATGPGDSPPGRLPTDRVALAGLALVLTFLFRDALLGGVFFRRDVHLVWHPQVEGFVHAVLGGAWPVWDPNPAFGQPLLADPSAQVLYPPTWLNLLMPPWTYYTAFVISHCLFTAWGTYRLSRQWDVSRTGAFVAATLWITCGPFLSLLDLWHHFSGAAWIPWVLAAVDRAFRLRTPRAGVSCGLVVAMQILSGSADMCAMTLITAGSLAAACRLEWRRGAASVNLRSMAIGALAIATALALSAGLWMTALDVVSRSARANLPEGVRTYWSVHPLGLAELAVPGIWTLLPPSPALREMLFESREPFLASLYLGIPALGLAAAALPGRGDRRVRVVAGLFVAALLFSLGRHLPPYSVAITLIPPLRILRYPVKVMVLAGFLASMLAGLGFDGWREGTAVRAKWFRVVAAVGVVGFLSALTVLAFSVVRREALIALLSVASEEVVAAGMKVLQFRLGFAGALSGLVALLAWRRSGSVEAGAFGAVLAAIALGDRLALDRNPSPMAPVALYSHRPPVLELLRSATRVYVYDYTQRDKSDQYLHRPGPSLARAPEGWSREGALALASQMALMPATAGRWGVKTGFEIDYRGLHAEPLARICALLRAFEGSKVHHRLLRMASVTHAVTLHDRGFEDLASQSVPGLFEEAVRVFRIPDALPRTFVVSGARVADGMEALEALVSPEFDPARQVLVPSGRAAPPDAAPVGRSSIVDERADRVRLEADLEQPGYVVLTDGFDPGWQATLDGAPAPSVRANLVFRAVAVPAGRHGVEWTYRPAALRLGLAVSAVALLAALLFLGVPPPRTTGTG